MDAIRAEIERKRKIMQKTEITDPAKKFFKRGDVALRQSEEYWEKRLVREAVKAKFDLPDADATSAGLATRAERAEADDEKHKLPRAEVVRRLRERSQPIILFGESDADANRRLRQMEIDAPDFKQGRRNDFNEALSAVDADYMKEVIEGTSHNKSDDKNAKHDVQTDNTLLEFDEVIAMAKDITDGDKFNLETNARIVWEALNFLLQKWGFDLNARSSEEKRVPQGRFLAGKQKQTCEYMKPLFSSLKDKTVASDILRCLSRIVKHLLARNYIEANNSYMMLAIGNAPWPVGATRTGIHVRPNQSKMFESQIAHVLNDETQRKYIQGLKRLMTKCQEWYPSDDPAKSVDYIPPAVRHKQHLQNLREDIEEKTH